MKPRLIKQANCGLADHERGTGCHGRHQQMYGLDDQGRYWRTNGESRWVICHEKWHIEAAKKAL